MDLSGKNVIYAGGYGGIGFAACKLLLSKNVANLIVLDKYEYPGKLEQLQALNPNTSVHYYLFDVTFTLDKMLETFRSILAKVQRLDVLINGVGMLNDLAIDFSIRTNLTGLITTSTAAFELWSRHLHGAAGTGGLIVNISSMAGLDPLPALPIYSATKAGVIAYTRSIAQLHDETGIAAICICPGVTRTPMIDHMPSYLNVDLSLTSRTNMLPVQSAEECAANIVAVIEQHENGSIWMLDQGKMCQVEMPVHRQAPQELLSKK